MRIIVVKKAMADVSRNRLLAPEPHFRSYRATLPILRGDAVRNGNTTELRLPYGFSISILVGDSSGDMAHDAGTESGDPDTSGR